MKRTVLSVMYHPIVPANLNVAAPSHKARRRNRRSGSRPLAGQTLSLIETLVIVAIIAILAAILIQGVATVRRPAQTSSSESFMKNIAAGVEMYYGSTQSYPAGSAA